MGALQIISDGQVHLPVRLLARDLVNGGMPVVRYSIEKVTKASRSDGESAILPQCGSVRDALAMPANGARL
jgi:phenylacetate-coenzyme A ligase PaaK-like adenylate-forming protein